MDYRVLLKGQFSWHFVFLAFVYYCQPLKYQSPCIKPSLALLHWLAHSALVFALQPPYFHASSSEGALSLHSWMYVARTNL